MSSQQAHICVSCGHEEENPLMTLKEAAAELRLSEYAVGHGEAGTGCLKKLYQGRLRFLNREQVYEHRRMVLQHGTCAGRCEDILRQAEERPVKAKGHLREVVRRDLARR